MVPSSKVNVELEGNPLLEKKKKRIMIMSPPEQNSRTPLKLWLNRPWWGKLLGMKINWEEFEGNMVKPRDMLTWVQFFFFFKSVVNFPFWCMKHFTFLRGDLWSYALWGRIAVNLEAHWSSLTVNSWFSQYSCFASLEKITLCIVSIDDCSPLFSLFHFW